MNRIRITVAALLSFNMVISPCFAEHEPWWSPGTVFWGKGQQNNGSEWTILIEVIDDSMAKIFYDSIPCSGVLRVKSLSDELAVTRERITQNKQNCVDGGTVRVAKAAGGSFTFNWVKNGDVAIGLLELMDQ